jgi:hypothetical protein
MQPDDDFQIEAILDMREGRFVQYEEGGGESVQRQYLVKWVGQLADTWEPAGTLGTRGNALADQYCTDHGFTIDRPALPIPQFPVPLPMPPALSPGSGGHPRYSLPRSEFQPVPLHRTFDASESEGFTPKVVNIYNDDYGIERCQILLGPRRLISMTTTEANQQYPAAVTKFMDDNFRI